MRSNTRTGPAVVAVVGVGLDGDGQTRITRADDMTVLGGSAETHGRMQETAIRFTEGLEKRGKTLREASLPEVVEALMEAREKVG